ncbi:hypothetical protein [Pseudomonas syringae]|uniref:Uncharacterized protein n=1 Tax=Pseudomonas syringae UB303 TaxID=1357287 RepID=A0AAJ4E710_PSESX|nr:hypothetical protein [Pseudomonas syringae]QHF10378.1 hypothetical protein N026_24145 [Pseudomonas syringae UB303]
MTIYSFKKRVDTGEHHIFEGEMRPPGSKPACNAAPTSICKKVGHDDTTVWVDLNCLSEQQARLAGAVLGRKLCGTCVSHLYATPAK